MTDRPRVRVFLRGTVSYRRGTEPASGWAAGRKRRMSDEPTRRRP